MKEVYFKALKKEDMAQIVEWRNSTVGVLRTPFLMTKDMQEEFYERTVCDRGADSRYFAIHFDGSLVGMAGVNNISWENRNGEISLLVNPKLWGKGIGSMAVLEILRVGFNCMNLENIYGECYFSNRAGIKFWESQIERFHGYTAILPNRKFFGGEYYDSLYFSFNRKTIWEGGERV